jgi:hypothetical protein
MVVSLAASNQHSAVSFQLPNERRKHAFDFCSVPIQILILIQIEVGKIASEDQLILQLAGRSHGYLQETAEVQITASTTALGDVHRNGTGTLPHLTCKAVQFLSWKLAGYLIHTQRQAMGLLPDHQLPKVFHDPSLPLADR